MEAYLVPIPSSKCRLYSNFCLLFMAFQCLQVVKKNFFSRIFSCYLWKGLSNRSYSSITRNQNFATLFIAVLCAVLRCSVVSDSLQPHGLQLARILCPWGVSKQEYWSELPFLSPEDLPNPGNGLRSPALQADSLPSEPPGKPKNTGVGSLSLLQGIFQTQESNQGLLHCRQILYQLRYQGSPFIANDMNQHIIIICLYDVNLQGRVYNTQNFTDFDQKYLFVCFNGIAAE